MNSKIFSFRKRIKSFYYAFSGLKTVLINEHNFRIHLLAAIFAIIAGTLFNISSMEWISITLIIALVLSLEIINSAIEKLADFVSPEKNIKIKAVKDMAAAAVLVAAIASLIIAAIIFIPKLSL
jgi:diacylglycerol kinase